jgi:hypothetical protein
MKVGLTGKFKWLIPIEGRVKLASILGKGTSIAYRQLG